mgnify:CR=1 FL=1
MVTAYEKRAGAEVTHQEKPKLYVKKPVYRPRLPKARTRAPKPRYKPPARARPKPRIVRDEEEIDYPDEKQSEIPDSAEDRLSKIYEMKPKKQQPTNRTNNITRKRRHLLFMNPGETVIMNCILSFTQNRPLPAWARPFRQNLRYNRNIAKLSWIDSENPGGLPFALFHDKRDGKRYILIPGNPARSNRLRKNFTKYGRISTEGTLQEF